MRRFFLLFLLFSYMAKGFAQQTVTDAGLIHLFKLQDRLYKHQPVEKLYMQTDKPFYAAGDTIWFKAYLFNADYLTHATQSGLMYVELANEDNFVVSRTMLPVGYGITYGNIATDGKNIPEGSYTLRAYTNWMRNFGEDYTFTKSMYIIGEDTKPWLVNVRLKSFVVNGKEDVYASLSLKDVNQQPVALRDMRFKVNDGNHTLFSDNLQTDGAGTMGIDFSLPAKANTRNLNIVAEDMRKEGGNRKVKIPVMLNRPGNTDLQFMPEGGSLVGGFASKIGFKALSEDGKGAFVSGKVYNSKQEEVAAFSALHNGMGSFNLVPQNGETYTAKINLPNGQAKSFALPLVKGSGTVLNVVGAPDSLTVHLGATGDRQTGVYYLIGQSRGIICYAQPVKFRSAAGRTFTLSKNLFPSGIARFSLLTLQGQPLNERIAYIDHDDNLRIALNTDKKNYAARDSIALQIKVTDKTGNPVQGSFSLAVTDDGQVPIDSLANNLNTDLLLTSDLKGAVEEPAYYSDRKNQEALDNLLLTQGWVGYDWQQLTDPALPIKFEAEQEFKVKGTVFSGVKKPVAGSKVVLLSKKPKTTQLSKTDANGQFEFSQLPQADTAVFTLQATNKNGVNDGIGIWVDEFHTPVFSTAKIRTLPWYVNTDTAMQRSMNKMISQRVDEEKLAGNHTLKQVEITERKFIKGSHNLNGAGAADDVFDEKDLAKVGKTTLIDLIQKMVPRLSISSYLDPVSLYFRTSYTLGQNEVHFIIDGSDLDNFYNAPPAWIETPSGNKYWGTRQTDPYGMNDRMSILNSFLANFNSDDIAGVELMTDYANQVKYNDNNQHLNEARIALAQVRPGGTASAGNNDGAFGSATGDPHQIDLHYGNPLIAYIEITTKTGEGPWRAYPVTGRYVYKALPFNIAKQFYSPKYKMKTSSAIKDLRSTIHWEPNIITDKQGKATISFYTSDRPGNYTVIMEGSDMNGKIGSTIQKLTLAKNNP